MNLILVPRSAGARRHVSLSHGQVLLVAVVLLAVLPILIGSVTYQIKSMLHPLSAANDEDVVLSQQQLLALQKQEVEDIRRNADTHLNALAQRMGQMQAQLQRLNALGQRLTRMAGLDKGGEFNFSEEPAMGGPETQSAAGPRQAVPDFMRSLDELSSEIERKSERLSLLETMLLDRQLQAEVYPAGWPVESGWVSSGFGVRSDPFTGRKAIHEGVDIASRLGSPIKALGGGVVSYAGEKQGYGMVVEINHGNGYTTRYAHAREVLVKVGDRIEKGQEVALVGSSGRSTGPHLHFEVLREGRAVNPSSYLKAAE